MRIILMYSLIYLSISIFWLINPSKLALSSMSVNIKSYLSHTNMLNMLLCTYIDIMILRVIVAMSVRIICLFFCNHGIIFVLCFIEAEITISNRKISLINVIDVLYCDRCKPNTTPVPMM